MKVSYNLNSFKGLFSNLNWKSILIASLLGLGLVALLFPQPNVIQNSLNINELPVISKINDYDNPWYRAVGAPFIVPAIVLNSLIENAPLAARIISGLFVFGTIILFYKLIKAWFNQRMALIAAALLASNSLVLNTARQATLWAASLFIIVAVFYCLNLFLRSKDNKFWAFLAFVASIAIAAYLPYGIWIIAIATVGLFIYGKKKLKKISKKQLIIAGTLYILLLLPLLISLSGAPGQLKELLGIYGGFIGPRAYILHLIYQLTGIYLYAQLNSVTWVGNLPLLDIFTAALSLLGIFYFIRRFRHRRSILIFSSFITLFLTIGLSANYLNYQMLFLPILYIFFIAGLIELMKRWLTIFPRNPLVRTIGVSLVVIAVAFSVFFQLERYFVAWSNSPTTKSVYMIKYNQ
jgi:4-amino-4-deoxy-L-arabinose transferase-like glycosyltransferase